MKILSTDSSETRKAARAANVAAAKYQAQGIRHWVCCECGETWSNEYVGYWGPVCHVECEGGLAPVKEVRHA